MPRRRVFLSFFAALWSACGTPGREPIGVEPPRGDWQMRSIDGSIQVRQGGPPVICREGEVESRPAPLFDPDAPEESTLSLEGGTFSFSFVFEENGYFDRFTNSNYGGDSFRGRWYESLSELRTEGRLNWEEGQVAGSVTTGSAPEVPERSTEFSRPGIQPGTEKIEEPWMTFEVTGRFVDASELVGEWRYQERTRLGGCWSVGEGAGSWSAHAPPPLVGY